MSRVIADCPKPERPEKNMAKKWTDHDIPDLHGKRVVITGANGGLGIETAQALTAHGAQVILAVRSPNKGHAVAQAICDRYPNAGLEIMRLDLADLGSVHTFALDYLERYPTLDLLINLAGVMAIPLRHTADGFEMQLGINHLGHFALTGLLLPALLRAEEARVVTVSSIAHYLGSFNFRNLADAKSYRPWSAYSRSKLANLLFAYELQRRFEAFQSRPISVGCHPGYADTNLALVGPRMAGSRPMEKLMMWANRTFAQSAVMGALSILYAAAAADVAGGDYLGPRGPLGMRGYPGKARSSWRSHDPLLARRLWELSEEMTCVHYSLRWQAF